MKKTWEDRKNILCIRLDNMGDLLMSSLAIQALKDSFKAKITVLTSSMAGGIAKHMPCIDEVIIADVPWVKSAYNEGAAGYIQLVETLRRHRFDAVVVFTVFSQNPLPAVMLGYLAGIPYRLAYCRENPYDLLTHWVPDREPYTMVQHQVERDLELVKTVGAKTKSHELCLKVPNMAYAGMSSKLKAAGVRTERPWMLVHPGASEAKRLYPPDQFKAILKKIIEKSDTQVVLTGTIKEKMLTEQLAEAIPTNAVQLAGSLSLEEFMAVIDIAPVVLSVNTGTIHIAAALCTPVVVLYALTNPQHTPWKVPHRVFPFPVNEELKSRNEVLKYVTGHVMEKCEKFPDPEEVADSVMKLMQTARQRSA